MDLPSSMSEGVIAPVFLFVRRHGGAQSPSANLARRNSEYKKQFVN